MLLKNKKKNLNQVKIVKLNKNLPTPSYANYGDAGLDVYASLEQDIVIGPGERYLVPTGIKMQLPIGFEAQVRPRSGLALKKGLTVLNSPGTIDSQYTGEVGVIIINNDQLPQRINIGDKIAQLVINELPQIEILEVEELESTERGEGGFGSSGEK